AERAALRLAQRKSAEVARIDFLEFLIELCLQSRMSVAEIEVLQIFNGSRLLAADRIEEILHLGREFVIDEFWQVQFQQLGNGECRPGRHQRVTLFEYVLPGENRV